MDSANMHYESVMQKSIKRSETFKDAQQLQQFYNLIVEASYSIGQQRHSQTCLEEI